MDYRIAQRTATLSPSLTLSISARAREMRSAGIDVVGFGAGEPDFDTPQHIKDACAEALQGGFTKYVPSSGIPELREAIARKLEQDNGLSYQPKQIIVTNGGKHACFNAFLATCQEPDEVLIPSPYWLSYPEMVKLAGAKPVFLETSDETGFKVTPDRLQRALTSRTRVFVLNSPGNPTGVVYEPEEIRALGEICAANGVLILSDEIYEKLLYGDAEHVSVASFSDRLYAHTMLAHGLAKAYSMTGWRIGFLAAPAPIAEAVDALQSHSTSNANSFAQKGAVAALTGSQAHLNRWREEFDKRRLFALRRLQAMPGVRCVEPRGAFYLFPNIADCGLDSRTFCERLLEEGQVAAVPGVAFGSDAHLRISYATGMETLEKGMDRLERFIRSL